MVSFRGAEIRRLFEIYFRLPLDFLLRSRALDLVLPFLPERLGLVFRDGRGSGLVGTHVPEAGRGAPRFSGGGRADLRRGRCRLLSSAGRWCAVALPERRPRGGPPVC